jgi:hypothetical protein
LLAGVLGEFCLTAAGCALTRPNPEVTPQVDSSPNMLNGKSLKELASVLGLTTQVEKVLTASRGTPQVTPQVETHHPGADRHHGGISGRT